MVNPDDIWQVPMVNTVIGAITPVKTSVMNESAAAQFSYLHSDTTASQDGLRRVRLECPARIEIHSCDNRINN